MKKPKTKRHNTEPSVTLEDVKRLSEKAYDKAIHESKDLFELSLRIDQKISDGISQVDKQVNRYTTFIGVIVAIAGLVIALASFLGSRSKISQYTAEVEKTISERFVSEKISNQLKQYADDNVAPLIEASVKETEEEIKAELEQIQTETAGLQTAIHSARKEIKAISTESLVTRDMMDVSEQIAAARTGDRIAYDVLRTRAKGNDRSAHLAHLGVEGINRSYNERKITVGRATIRLQNLKTGEKGVLIPSEEAMRYIYDDNIGVCEGALNSLVDRAKLQYVATLVHVVMNSRDLDCVYAGIRGLEKLLDKQFPALGIDEVIAWWDEHKEDEVYHDEFEKVCGALQQHNESDEAFKWRQVILWEEWLDEEPGRYWAAEHLMNLLLNFKEEGSGKRQEMMEHVLKYWECEHPLSDTWYIGKAMYLWRYGSEKEITDFVNARLVEHPGFETELRRFEDVYFPRQFFQKGTINWPSKSSVRLEDDGVNTEKVAE